MMKILVTPFDCTRKFRNFWGYRFVLCWLSDRLCLENKLSIVENPEQRKIPELPRRADRTKQTSSVSEPTRLTIDTALAEHPADLDEFLGLMKRAEYEVKNFRGDGISFRLTGQGQEHFPRLPAYTLGNDYDLKDLLAAIKSKEKCPGRPGSEKSVWR